MSDKVKSEKIDVAYVAKLARLNLTVEEQKMYQAQLEDILDYVDKISELDLSNVEPTAHVRPIQNIFRKDQVKSGLDTENVMDNAPLQSGNLFTVPKIIE